MGIFERGTVALNEDQIEMVVQRILITDANKTYGQVLTDLGVGQTQIKTQIGELRNDVEDLEDYLFTLAGGNR